MKKLKKECPKGFDPISFLLAEKKGTVIETNEGSTISIVSPIVTQRSLN